MSSDSPPRPTALERLAGSEPILGVCGPSGAGKTTLLVEVIPELRRRGLRVAVVKHDIHGLTVDPAAKDSARLFAAGADVILDGPAESLRRDHRGGDLPTMLADLLVNHDLVLVEGHRGSPLPKVWLADARGHGPDAGVPGVLEVLPRDERRCRRFLNWIDDWLAARWRSRPVLGGVLVGGRARRMGRPKQLLTHQGRTLLEIAVGALATVTEEVLLLGDGRCPDALAELKRLPDATGTDGPLAGLLAALRWAPRAAWIVTACDMPLLSPAAARWLVAQRRPGCWAVLPRVRERGMEPLLAVYEPQALSLLERLSRQGCRAPCEIAADPAVLAAEPPAELRQAWYTANTPEELAAVADGHFRQEEPTP